MQIPCGMLQYKHGFGANIFMHVGKHDHSYEIPFREPLVSIFPMSELPLHVESYFDRRRFMELADRSNELPFSHELSRQTRETGSCGPRIIVSGYKQGNQQKR